MAPSHAHTLSDAAVVAGNVPHSAESLHQQLLQQQQQHLVALQQQHHHHMSAHHLLQLQAPTQQHMDDPSGVEDVCGAHDTSDTGMHGIVDATQAVDQQSNQMESMMQTYPGLSELSGSMEMGDNAAQTTHPSHSFDLTEGAAMFRGHKRSHSEIEGDDGSADHQNVKQ